MATERLAPLPADPRAALEPYQPAQGHGPWNERLAAHFLGRALGGSRRGELAEAVALGPQGLAEQRIRARQPEDGAAWERLGDSIAARGARAELAAWWLQKLIAEDRAPGARLTLFWHDHFATTWSKVRDGQQMLAQHRSFAELGEGPFASLLAAIARDPAMLRFLDNEVNRRGLPNENLAREIMELFSLGLGAYDERDVQEAARALTGRTVRHGRYHFEPMHHDPEPKTVLGKRVADGEGLVAQIVAQEACPEFLAGKLWRFYVSPEPPQEVIELLAARWREHELEVLWLVDTLLRSRAFYSAEAVGSLVRSPVDLVVATARALGARPDLRAVEAAASAMGQELFEPPGVQGWEAGQAWIHSSAWLERMRFADQVAYGRSSWHRGVELAAGFPPPSRAGGRALLAALAAALLPGALAENRQDALLTAVREAGSPDFAGLGYAILCLPEYHLA